MVNRKGRETCPQTKRKEDIEMWRVRAEITGEFNFYKDFKTVDEANAYFDELNETELYDAIIVWQI